MPMVGVVSCHAMGRGRCTILASPRGANATTNATPAALVPWVSFAATRRRHGHGQPRPENWLLDYYVLEVTLFRTDDVKIFATTRINEDDRSRCRWRNRREKRSKCKQRYYTE
jgi:hypothetical protein